MSTAPEDMACRQIHGTISHRSHPSHIFFFHVLYHNAMTFDSDLKFVGSTALEHLYAAASRTSRLDGECE